MLGNEQGAGRMFSRPEHVLWPQGLSPLSPTTPNFTHLSFLLNTCGLHEFFLTPLSDRGPQSPGHELVLVCGQSGTAPHSRRWVRVSKRSFVCIYSYSRPIRLAAGSDSHRSTRSRLHVPYKNLMPDDLILHCGQPYNYFIIYHNALIIELKCSINVMYLNHP